MKFETNRLSTIEVRQRSSRLRDLAFAAFIVLAGGLAISTVSVACQAAQVAQR